MSVHFIMNHSNLIVLKKVLERIQKDCEQARALLATLEKEDTIPETQEEVPPPTNPLNEEIEIKVETQEQEKKTKKSSKKEKVVYPMEDPRAMFARLEVVAEKVAKEIKNRPIPYNKIVERYIQEFPQYKKPIYDHLDMAFSESVSFCITHAGNKKSLHVLKEAEDQQALLKKHKEIIQTAKDSKEKYLIKLGYMKEKTNGEPKQDPKQETKPESKEGKIKEDQKQGSKEVGAKVETTIQCL